MDPTKQQKIIGIFQGAIYRGSGGFLIGKFDVQEKSGAQQPRIAIGTMLNPEIGMKYSLYGRWVTHEKFGEQFKFTFYKADTPMDPAGIFQYLVRIAKWVGPTTGNALVDKYGPGTLKILKENPRQVAADIKGLTLERAEEIQTALIANEKLEKAHVDLETIFSKVQGLNKNLAVKMIQRYGANAVQTLKQNPYCLTGIKGIGFPTADQVARVLGIALNAPQRIKAAILHIVTESMNLRGDVWIPIPDIRRECLALVGTDCIMTIRNLLDAKKIAEHENFVTTMGAAADECLIASRIATLTSSSQGNDDI